MFSNPSDVNICFVSWSFIDAGSTTALNEYALSLSKMGFNVSIIGRGDEAPCRPTETFQIMPVRDKYPSSTKLSHIYFLIRASQIIAHNRFDIINVFNSPGISLLRLRFLFFHRNLKWVYHIRTSDLYEGVKGLLKNAVMRFESLFFDAVTIIHRKIAENMFFSKRKQSSFYELPLGINTKSFVRDENISSVQLLGERVKEKRILLSVGTLHPTRKLTRMIEAFDLVLQGYKDCVLVVIGDGLDLPVLQRRVRELGIDDHVIFLGRVSYKEIPRYLSVADIALTYLPVNRKYNYQPPVKVLEYLQMEVPQVATDTKVIHDFLENGESGIITGDAPTEFAEGIKELIGHKELYAKIKKSSRMTVKDHSWDSIVQKKFLPILEQLMEKDKQTGNMPGG